MKLRQISRRVTQLYEAELAREGLRSTQYSLLSTVLAMGPARPADLALALTMDRSTLTRCLRPLIAAGWVRIGAGEDGRSRAVSITAAGRAKRDEATRAWQRAQRGLVRTLGAARVDALHALVDEALALLGNTPGDGDA
ncbi:MAG: MarR family winged helix-turn-helix transcriptional regulator [Lautropia sp.]